MSFPKKGKFFPGGGPTGGVPLPEAPYLAAEIAAALKRSLGPTRAGIKTAVGWTGANERTAKNWFAGRYSPSAEHLVALARHSDEVLNVFLTMAGRPEMIAPHRLKTVEQTVSDFLAMIQQLTGRST
jgi:hypothetical protein